MAFVEMDGQFIGIGYYWNAKSITSANKLEK